MDLFPRLPAPPPRLTDSLPSGSHCFPLMAGSHFLSRLPGQIGMYLALSGARLKVARRRPDTHATEENAHLAYSLFSCSHCEKPTCLPEAEPLAFRQRTCCTLVLPRIMCHQNDWQTSRCIPKRSNTRVSCDGASGLAATRAIFGISWG